MQINSLYLYSNKIDVFTNTLATWKTERYRRVYNRNLKIYRSVDNRIDLQVRNSDQKATTIAGSVLVFNLVSRDKNLILSKDCTSVSDSTGNVYVTLTQAEMYNLESGFYDYSIVQEVRTAPDGTAYVPGSSYIVSSKTPLYVGAQYEVLNTLEVLNDVQGGVVNSLVVSTFRYINPFTLGVNGDKYYISSIIDANQITSTSQSVHTFQFYTTNYSGSVVIQGSLDVESDPSTWVDLSTTTVSNSDITYKNVEGKYNWFRIKHTPDISNTGTVDKVLYR